jgi:helicase
MTQPGTGHGFLTHAVIEAWTGCPASSVSFPEIAGEIIRIARVEAERISITQTPVFLGNVQGGPPRAHSTDVFAEEESIR